MSSLAGAGMASPDPMKRTPLPLGFLLLALTVPALGYKEVAPPEKVVLPQRRTPAESLASISVPPGLEVELVASEPMVKDPIDLAWDAAGRLWVVEMADYPAGVDGLGTPGGRIRVLESTRGDGRFDRMTLFAEGLSFPTSVLPWRNGVIVTAVPHILFLEDTDGDGRADRTTRLFSGTAEGNQQHIANGLQWSLDGWVHLGNGNSGGKVTSPQSPRPLELGQRDFRIRPATGAVELVTGQTQVGRNRDDWGNWFGCNNSNPIWHYALEERYVRRNPHFSPPNATVNVAAIPGASRVYPRSTTFARFNDPQGFNHFTSACGVMIYRDDWLGTPYAGNVFVCEPVHNLVHREILRPLGATFRSERAPTEQASEFFASTDNWSRFTAARAGPDGALYMVDMYRLVIEHPKWIPDAWQKEIGNLRAGDDAGRIYRVKPKGATLRPVPRLDRADARALAASLQSPSGVVRDLAQQQLTWRGAGDAVAAIASVAADATLPAARAQAIWTLHTTDKLTPAVVARALRDPHPGVRQQAVRLSEEWVERAPELLGDVARLAEDPDPAVRRQVGYTLGEWRVPAAGVALARLLQKDDDRWVRAAAMSSALPHADTLIAEIGATAGADSPLLIEIATATENARGLAALLKAIAAPRPEAGAERQLTTLGLLLDWLQKNNRTLAQLETLGGASLAPAVAAVDAVFATARRVGADAAAPGPERLAAVRVLGRGRTLQTEDMQQLLELLAPTSPIELQLAAIASLGRINRSAVPERMLERWNGSSSRVRAAMLDLCLSRPAWAQVLLDRAEASREMLAQIDASRRAALMQHGNVKLAERATALFAAGIDVNRQAVIERYATALAARTGDPQRGAGVFAAACSACHVFGSVAGRRVGPDLATVKDRSAPYLLTHILDPNRAVEDRYVLYTVTTQDGRAVSGMLGNESGNSLTLIGLDGAEQSLLRSEVRSLVSGQRSLMPDGLEGAIDEQGMTDLIAFLAAGGK